MNEFMRKHGKWILAILGVVLMVMWVMPNKGNGGGGGRDRTVGHLDGKKILLSDVQQATAEVEALQTFAQIALRDLHSQSESIISLFVLVGARSGSNYKGELNPHHPALHYLLLVREARSLGMTYTEGDVNRVIADAGMNDADLAMILKPTGLSPYGFKFVIGDFVTILKARELVGQAINVSLPEVEHVAMNQESTVAAAYITLGTENPPDSIRAPLSDALARHFEAYKDVLPEDARRAPKEIGGHFYPFGYKYPDRVKVEYLKFSWKDVRAQAMPKNAEESAADQQSAWDYYDDKANEKEFMVAPPTTTSTSPATAPARKKDFKEVRAALVERQIDQRAMAKLKEIADRALAIAAEPFKQAGAGSDKPAELKPDAWVPYAKVAIEIKKAAGIAPEHHDAGPWLGMEELAALPGIGKAGMPTPAGKMEPFATLALSVSDINQAQTGLALRLQLRCGADGPVVFDEANNAYVYRIVAAEKAHAPASFEEIRDQVARDLRRVDYYKVRIDEAKAVVADAEKNGINAAAEHIKAKVIVSAPFQRKVLSASTDDTQPGRTVRVPPIQGLGFVPTFTEAAFGLAQRVGAVDHATSRPATAPSSQPDKAATTSAPATTTASTTSAPALTKGTPTASVAIEQNLAVYVLQVDAYSPLPIDQFERRRQYLAMNLVMKDQEVFTREWGSLKAVAARLNYKPEEGMDLEKE